MKVALTSLVCLAGVLILAGCGGSMGFLKPGGDDSQADALVDKSLDAIGSQAAWSKVGSIDCWAIVTSYDEAGLAALTRLKLTIYPGPRKISTVIQTSDGPVSVTADESGIIRSMFFPLKLDGEVAQRLDRELAMILYHVLGPLNLIDGTEVPGSVSNVQVAGEDLIRLSVDGGSPGRAAYYFKGQERLLRLVTVGGDEKGSQGTAAIYDYINLPDGLSVPRRIRIVKIGQTSIIGDQPVLVVELTDVSVHRGIKSTRMWRRVTNW